MIDYVVAFWSMWGGDNSNCRCGHCRNLNAIEERNILSENEERTLKLQQFLKDYEFIYQALKTARELKKDLTIFHAKIDAVNNDIVSLYNSKVT